MKAIKTNLNLYKSFVEVYETKNYSVAAANLHLTQPTISYNIKELEKQLAIRLFNSNSRGVEPTQNANELYPIVRDAFSQLLTAETIVQEFTDKSQGIVNLSISLHYIPQKINDMIARFNQKFPNTKFNIKMRTFDDGIIALGKHEADISIFAYSKPLDIDESKFITKNLSTITIIEGDKTQKFNLAILFGCNLTSKFATAFIDFICPRP